MLRVCLLSRIQLNLEGTAVRIQLDVDVLFRDDVVRPHFYSSIRYAPISLFYSDMRFDGEQRRLKERTPKGFRSISAFLAGKVGDEDCTSRSIAGRCLEETPSSSSIPCCIARLPRRERTGRSMHQLQ